MPETDKKIPLQIEALTTACEKSKKPTIAKTILGLNAKQKVELLTALPWDSEVGARLLKKFKKKGGTFKTAANKIGKCEAPPTTLLKNCFDATDCWPDLRQLILLWKCCCCCGCWPPLPWWKCCCGIRVYPKDGNPDKYVRATSIYFEGDAEVTADPAFIARANVNITGGPGGDVHWADILDKPATFPPSAHDHDGVYALVVHEHAGLYAEVVHDHDGVYAPDGHDHDTDYAALGHDHTGTYSPAGHDHAGVYADAGHDHDADYSDIGHDHAGTYSPVDHNHDGEYAAADHHHFGVYAPVAHNHDGSYYTKGQVDTQMAGKANTFCSFRGEDTGTTGNIGPDQGALRVDFPSACTRVPVVQPTVVLRADSGGLTKGATAFAEVTAVDANGFDIKVYENNGGPVMSNTAIDVTYLAIEPC